MSRAGLTAALLPLVFIACAGRHTPDPASLPLPARETLDPAAGAEIDRLRAVLLRDPELAATWGELGEVLDAHEVLEAAVMAYGAAAGLDPGNPDWPYLLGHLELRRGRPDAAMTAFEAAIDLAPHDPLTSASAARAANLRGDFERAAALARASLALEPSLAIAQVALGDALRALGDHRAAADAFTAALHLQPRADRLHRLLAAELRRLDEPDLAKQHEQLAGNAPVEVADPRLRRVAGRARSLELEANAATTAFQAGRLGEAEARWRRILAGAPNDLRALVGLGSTLVQAGRSGDGEAHFRRVTAIDPTHALANFNLAALAARQGDDAAAIHYGEIAVARDPTFYDARFNLGNALRRSGRPGDSIEHYRRIVAAQPTRAPAWHALAAALAAVGEWQQAALTVQSGLEAAPGDLGLRIARARLLATAPVSGLRNAAEALREAETLVQLAPGPITLEALAMAQAEAGRFEAAQSTIDAASAAAQAAPTLAARVAARIAAASSTYRAGQPLRAAPLD